MGLSAQVRPSDQRTCVRRNRSEAVAERADISRSVVRCHSERGRESKNLSYDVAVGHRGSEAASCRRARVIEIHSIDVSWHPMYRTCALASQASE